MSLLNQTLKISFRFCHIFLLVKVSPLITNEPHYPAYTQPVKRQEEERGRGQFNRLTGTVQNPLIITHFNHPSESHKEIKAIKGLRQRTVKIPLVFKRWMPRAFPKVLSKILSMTVGILLVGLLGSSCRKKFINSLQHHEKMEQSTVNPVLHPNFTAK